MDKIERIVDGFLKVDRIYFGKDNHGNDAYLLRVTRMDIEVSPDDMAPLNHVCEDWNYANYQNDEYVKALYNEYLSDEANEGCTTHEFKEGDKLIFTEKGGKVINLYKIANYIMVGIIVGIICLF